MKTTSKAGSILLLLFLLSLFSPLPALQAAEFQVMVAPSLMDSEMDGWYKIPPNSGPNIHKTNRIYQDQPFSLLVFFSGYSADKNNNLHMRYDVQVYDPQGKPTDDKGSDLLAYQGPMGNPDILILPQQYLKIAFTEKYPLGTYKIKVTAYDKIANKSFSSETPLELVPFTMAEKFESQEEAKAWFMGYYKNPTPIKAINGLQKFVQLDPKWLNENASILTFFRRIYSENPFLLKNIARHFNSLPQDEQKRFLLISAISGDVNLAPIVNSGGNQELQKFHKSAKEIKIPDVNGEINTGVQLDILWSEFLATGKYNPIRKIVSALALNKYKGTLEKIKSKQIKEVTEEIKKQAYLEATYGAAIWSLTSNCKQMPLVFKYCVFMYKYEELDENIKTQLGAILSIAQKELQDNREVGKPKN